MDRSLVRRAPLLKVIVPALERLRDGRANEIERFVGKKMHALGGAGGCEDPSLIEWTSNGAKRDDERWLDMKLPALPQATNLKGACPQVLRLLATDLLAPDHGRRG